MVTRMLASKPIVSGYTDMSWKSSKQEIVADFTTKVEYMAASEAARSLFGRVPNTFYVDITLFDKGDVKICKVHTDLNIADPITKPLPQPKHEAHTRSMGIRYLHD